MTLIYGIITMYVIAWLAIFINDVYEELLGEVQFKPGDLFYTSPWKRVYYAAYRTTVVKPGDIWFIIKMAYLRVKNGHDYRAEWDPGSFMLYKMIELLTALKENVHGYPTSFSKTPAEDDKSMQEWRDTLQEIIDGLEVAKLVDEGEGLYKEHLGTSGTIPKGMLPVDRNKVKKAFVLLEEHLYSLWD